MALYGSLPASACRVIQRLQQDMKPGGAAKAESMS
jgi:hypothetical protein